MTSWKGLKGQHRDDQDSPPGTSPLKPEWLLCLENIKKRDLVQRSNTKGTGSSRDEKKNYYEEQFMVSCWEVGVFFNYYFHVFSIGVFPEVYIYIPFLLKELWLSSWKHATTNDTWNSFLSDNSSQFNYLSRRTGLLLLYPPVWGASMSRIQTTWIPWSNSHLRFR